MVFTVIVHVSVDKRWCFYCHTYLQ